MSWISQLCDTYDKCESVVGQPDDMGCVLLPLSHATQQAQIEIVLNKKGELFHAVVLEGKGEATLIPVTIDSGSRSSNCAPHPLHDKLKYVAGDYCKYAEGAKEKDEKCFAAYLENLKQWCESEYSHEIVRIIYQYVSKGCLIEDLIELGILDCEDGKLTKSKKIAQRSQLEVFVRFRVDDPIENIEVPWRDRSLHNAYIQYSSSQQDQMDLCFISGEQTPCLDKHPARVMNEADNTKLISSNDNTNFTYRGRFKNKNAAFSIGYESSLKAHNTLQWLIKRQGYQRGNTAIVAWETTLQKIIDLMGSTMDMFAGIESDESDNQIDVGFDYAQNLNRAILSYQHNLNEENQIVVLQVKAAIEGQGRLSLAYYNSVNGSEFLRRIRNWHSTCVWEHPYKKKDGSWGTFIGAPSFWDIARAAYGVERSGQNLEMDLKLQNQTFERLLPCVLNGKRLPEDLVRAAYHRALKPQAMSENNWNKVVSVTCALVCKYRKDKYEEEWSVSLKENETSIDYLYGRILAVMDAIEAKALYKMDTKRETNAMRYFNQFSRDPRRMLAVIQKRLLPYRKKLGEGTKWLEGIEEDILAKIATKDLNNIRNLDDRFILGFFVQKKAIKEYKPKKDMKKQQGGE